MESVLHRITMKIVKLELNYHSNSGFSRRVMCHSIKTRKWTGNKYPDEYLRFSKWKYRIITTAAGPTPFICWHRLSYSVYLLCSYGSWNIMP